MESIVSDTEDGFSLLTIQEKNKVVLRGSWDFQLLFVYAKSTP